jgi:hypothetical protein
MSSLRVDRRPAGRPMVVHDCVRLRSRRGPCWGPGSVPPTRCTGLAILVATRFSICGAFAIAAMEGVVRRRYSDVATAIALVGYRAKHVPHPV